MYPYQPYFKPESNLIRVTGIDGAKAYQMGANSTIALFDANDDLFYVKSTDGAGFPTIRIFRFESVDIETKEVETITRNDLESFKQEVLNDVQQLIQESATPDAKHKSGNNRKSQINNE